MIMVLMRAALLSTISFLISGATSIASDDPKCELLKTSLSYSQENAPRDISGVLPVIVERVNQELSGVVDVEVLFTGSEIHRRVGEHTVQCSVTRLLTAIQDNEGYDRVDDYVTQCFLVNFTILDVDECHMPLGHVMRHRCAEPSLCVNTLGSYECVCPFENTDVRNNIPEVIDERFWNELIRHDENRSSWDLSFGSSLQSSCPSRSSTYGCCDEDAHEEEGSNCRASFRCPVDPCQSSKTNTCVSSATCQRAENPLDEPKYKCICPDGLMGNGQKCRRGIDPSPKPKVKFDGITPTDETKKHNMYCGCTKPVADPCAGFPKCKGKNEVCTITNQNEPICACKPGYVQVEKFGCVDESPPLLQLRHDEHGDGITLLRQGDSYKEYAVDVIDDNAEDYLRSLKIAYSRPLPPGCLAEMGSFQVNYTVATPWTNPPYARVTRDVIIEDIDECRIDVDKYETQCPQLIPQCDVEAGASCKNTKGSYTCECPKFTTGDGFKFIGSVQKKEGKFHGAPLGYEGGTGCMDTSKPIIEIIGPNPKIFRTCKCGGLSGILRSTKNIDNEKDENMKGRQREGYQEDIIKMIQKTAGAELCATHTRNDPTPIDCVKAIDHTFRGNVDLSSKVSIGEPIQVSPLEWKIPYNVADDAGNAAETVWRRIVVEEVDLVEMEERIRQDILADKDQELERAIQEALQKERSKTSASPSKQQNVKPSPKCPVCECPKNGKSLTECEEYCESNYIQDTNNVCEQYAQSPKTFVHSILDGFIAVTDGVLSPDFASIVLMCSLALLAIFLLQRIFIANQEGWQYVSAEDEEREKEMLGRVTYFNGNHASSIPSPGAGAPPPRASMSGSAIGAGIFSPPENRVYGQQRDNLFSERVNVTPSGSNSIYQNGGVGSPNDRSNESRTPYNLRKRY